MNENERKEFYQRELEKVKRELIAREKVWFTFCRAIEDGNCAAKTDGELFDAVKCVTDWVSAARGAVEFNEQTLREIENADTVAE